MPALSRNIAIPLALGALYLIWGSTYLAIKIALDGFPPFTMGAIRFLLAGLPLYLVLRWRGVPNPTLTQWRCAVVIGILLLTGGNGGVVFAEQQVSSAVAALAVAAVPVLTVLFGRLWGERPTGLEWIGLGIGFVGLLVLNLEKDLRANVFGSIALLLAASSWAFGSVWSKRLDLPSGLMQSATQMIGGGAAFVLLAVAFDPPMRSLPGWHAIGAVVYLAFFGSIVAFSSYLYLLNRVRPALATSYAYVNPVVAVLLGMFVAGETIEAPGITALVIILIGVALVTLARR